MIGMEMGLNDLFIQTGGTPQTKVFTTLLNQSKDDLGNITFNFNPNYSAVLMVILVDFIITLEILMEMA